MEPSRIELLLEAIHQISNPTERLNVLNKLVDYLEKRQNDFLEIVEGIKNGNS